MARWLRRTGIEAYVIHPSSIPVPRGARVKTDRIDTGMLLRAFSAWLRGEPDACRMVAILSREEEDRAEPRACRPRHGADTLEEPDQVAADGCVCRKPHPCWWSERIGYPRGMIALILFVLGIRLRLKAKSRLEAENAALRQQLIVLRRKVKSRPRLANADRWFFVQLYRWFPSILDVLTIIRPETLVRWHRAGFRRCWHWKSRRRGGRPQVQSELRALIRQMSVENPLWGAPRIHGELLKLGFEVSQSSVIKRRQIHG